MYLLYLLLKVWIQQQLQVNYFHIFGALAQFERSLIQERVKAGLEAAKNRGIRGGRPRAISEEK